MKRKPKKIISYAAGAVLVFGAIWLASSVNWGGSTPYSASVILAIDKNWDFGTISMTDGNVSHMFELKNEGPEPIVINKVYTSCMCTEAIVFDADAKKQGKFGMPGHGLSKTYIEVRPGDTVKLEAIFDPAAHGPAGVGLVQRSIYIESNSQKVPKVELRFTAKVTR